MWYVYIWRGGPVSLVGIATCYGLDGPGIESQWGWDFPHLLRSALRPNQPPVQLVLRLSCGQIAVGVLSWPLTAL